MIKKILLGILGIAIIAGLFIYNQPEQTRGYSTEGLVGYWKMDDNLGTTNVIDSSVEGNHGTFNDANGNPNTNTHSEVSLHERSLKFDGVDDYVDVGNGSSLDITDAITMSAWVKVFSNGYVTRGGIFDRLATSSPWNGYVFDYSCLGDGKLSFFNTGVGTWVHSDGVISDGQWHHCVVTGLGTLGIFYIDGQQSGTFAFGGASSHSGNAMIGINYRLDYFNGSIDSVRIYNRALSADEVAHHYFLGSETRLKNATLKNCIIK